MAHQLGNVTPGSQGVRDSIVATLCLRVISLVIHSLYTTYELPWLLNVVNYKPYNIALVVTINNLGHHPID